MWHRYAHIPTPLYLLVIIFGLPWIRRSSDPMWVLVHLLLLGAITNLIFVWSSHFTATMLRLPPESDRKRYITRVFVLNLGVISVIVGKIQGLKFLMAYGAAAVVVSAGLHANSIRIQIARALPTRFKKIPRFYVASALFLILGGILGGLLSQGPKGELKYRLLVAHYSTNIFGWIGITIAGTLVTFIPTMLRTKLPDNAEKHGYEALPWLIASVLAIDAGALINMRALSFFGALAYFGSWIYLLFPHLRLIIRRRSTFSITSTIASLIWLVISLISLEVDIAAHHTWKSVSSHAQSLVYILGIGFALQMGLGALSYLIPAVLGGGSANARQNVNVMERLKTTRLILHNLGLGLLATNLTRMLFLVGGAMVGLTIILNFSLLVSLRPAKHE
jgi:nitrite reductase (NO-forming)